MTQMGRVEFTVRIDFYDDLRRESSFAERQAATSYVGSMTREGFKALSLPRIGEGLADLGPWTAPNPLAWVTSVEHFASGGWSDPGEADDGTTPRIVVVTRQAWVGTGESDQLIQEFEERGWKWLA